jgi:hypothetical protein
MDADGACDESTIRGQQNRVVLTPSRRCQVSVDETLATVATERGSPGRSRISRKPSRAGMLGNSGVNVVTNSCVYLNFTREAAGALGARHSPRPFGGGTIGKTRANSRRGNVKLRQTNTNAQHTRRHRPPTGRANARPMTGSGGRSSIPETSAIEPRSRGVLDPPHARGMTTGGEHRGTINAA